jgi:hypothetical protein
MAARVSRSFTTRSVLLLALVSMVLLVVEGCGGSHFGSEGIVSTSNAVEVG